MLKTTSTHHRATHAASARKSAKPANRDERYHDDEHFKSGESARRRERYGEQDAEQRRLSAAQTQQGNFGGQDSRDQGHIDPRSPRQAQPETQKAVKEPVPPQTSPETGFGAGRNEFGEEADSASPRYESDTRENLSRMYAEQKERRAGTDADEDSERERLEEVEREG